MKSVFIMQGASATDKETYIIDKQIVLNPNQTFEAGKAINQASQWSQIFKKQINDAKLKATGVSPQLQCFYKANKGIMIEGSFKELDSQKRLMSFSCLVMTNDIVEYFRTLNQIVSIIDKTYFEKDKELIIGLFKSKNNIKKTIKWTIIGILLLTTLFIIFKS